MLAKIAALLGGTQPIEAIGTLLDKLFTSDDERAQAEAVLRKLADHQAELQVELNKVEAAHDSLFVAGWRPFIGWICGVALAWTFIGHPLFEWAAALWGAKGFVPPLLAGDNLMELVIAMLGLSGLRTFEKTKRKS